MSALCLLEVLSCFFSSTFVPLQSQKGAISFQANFVQNVPYEPLADWGACFALYKMWSSVLFGTWVILRHGRWSTYKAMFEHTLLWQTQSGFQEKSKQSHTGDKRCDSRTKPEHACQHLSLFIQHLKNTTSPSLFQPTGCRKRAIKWSNTKQPHILCFLVFVPSRQVSQGGQGL
jgi:hypothetical protein